MRTKHERIKIWAKSALVGCQCGNKFELAEGSVEEATCQTCGDTFRLSDYRSPEKYVRGGHLCVPPAGTGDEGEVNPNNLEIEEFDISEPESDCE